MIARVVGLCSDRGQLLSRLPSAAYSVAGGAHCNKYVSARFVVQAVAACRRAPIATHTCLLTCMVVSAATAWQYCRFIQSGLWGSLDWALTSGGVCLTPVLGWFIHAGMLGDGNRCQGMGLWGMGNGSAERYLPGKSLCARVDAVGALFSALHWSCFQGDAEVGPLAGLQQLQQHCWRHMATTSHATGLPVAAAGERQLGLRRGRRGPDSRQCVCAAAPTRAVS